ncbi:MAG: permease-like cell division protein FtsX [Clostridia bacterium]|nr:permease-like cell division protein FtsX [Clostridia bacterium]
MSFDSLWFLLKSALNNLYRNLLLTVASVTVLTICLTLLGCTSMVIQNVNAFVDEIGESRIAVFLDENMTELDIARFRNELTEIGNVGDIHYETKEQALANYLESIGSGTGMEDALDADTFRASLIFEIIDLSKYDQTLYEIRKMDGVGDIQERRDVVDKIQQVKQALFFLSVLVIFLFFIVSVFIIMNSVKLSVYARRLEINIMKYVGATDFFIQLPYFIEGMIIGLIAGIVSFFVQFYVYNAVLYPLLAELFTPISFLSQLSFWVPFFAIGGSLIGIIGSVYPVKKYLKV